ncbi:MAG TPA: hypothetical protein VMX16_07100 [Terriglobia bacterium]|nr:hypothetical protein [Terriglobia bacterium]
MAASALANLPNHSFVFIDANIFVYGLSGLAAGAMVAAFTFTVGAVVDRFSYRPAFVAADVLPLFAMACVLLLIRSPQASGTQ